MNLPDVFAKEHSSVHQNPFYRNKMLLLSLNFPKREQGAHVVQTVMLAMRILGMEKREAMELVKDLRQNYRFLDHGSYLVRQKFGNVEITRLVTPDRTAVINSELLDRCTEDWKQQILGALNSL